MLKFIEIILAVLLTSFFYFPVEFVFLPGINTKMMLAVLGLMFAAYRLIQKKQSLVISRELLWMEIIAGTVSLVSLLSITINHTPDTSYVSYIISFNVWLSGAYAVCYIIKAIHGRIDAQLVLDYLAAACVFQCVMAIAIDRNPAVMMWVDRVFSFGQGGLRKLKRIYGIGAALDVAGMRFSAVLAGLGFYLAEIKKPLRPWPRILYILSFFIIVVIGNMVARTTLTGAIIGLAIIILGLIFKPADESSSSKSVAVLTWLGLLTLGTAYCVFLYNTDASMRKLFRFAFEGFFSLAEKGYWDVSSNNKLQTMVVFPETLHTWIIGDGYFLNSRYDINYLGDATDQGFYMGTDIGYLRFIFYFGIVGLIPMMCVILYPTVVCMRYFRNDRLLFLLAMLVGLIVWAKVSTDLFCFFALFLCAAALQDTPEEEVPNLEPDSSVS